MTPLVTIGIPCFNAAHWLGGAIESALGQRDVACEVIIVDDGSTDGSEEIARGFGERVRVFAGGHRGANHARNLAIREAGGEWMQFLDADDYLEPGKIARQLTETKDGANADVLFSPFWIETWSDGRVTDREPSPTRDALDLLAEWIAWRLPQTGGCLWRREALNRIGGWKEGQPCCQENELYLRAIEADLRFVFAPTPGAVYRIWSEQTLCRRDPTEAARVRAELIADCRAWMRERSRWKPEHEQLAAQIFFELSRVLAKYDLRNAAAWHREQHRRGLIHLAGPAAPRSYRLAYRLLGFTGAERFAAATRALRLAGH